MRIVFLVALSIALLAASAAAQSSRVGGTIAGVVQDASGARVPSARVEIRDSATGLLRLARTDVNGVFLAADLPVGVYKIQIAHPGFAAYVQKECTVELGAVVQLQIVLQPAASHSTITVTAQPSALETSEVSLTSRVDRERIEELPVESRNALDFVLIEPGVSPSPRRYGGSPHVALTDSGFTTGGLRPRSNSISIDGLNNNDEFEGSSRTELSPEIVQEYQVVRNGLSAEYGGASGGSINVVTRSGSNTIHGDAFIFLQDAALNARDPFETETAKPSFRRSRTGFAIGGPLIRNKMFYYTAFEQEHNRGQNGSDINGATASAINSFLAAGSFPGLPVRRITSGFFPISRAETETTGKLNDQLTPRNAAMLRYSFTNNREAGDAFNAGGLEDASARGSSFIADNALVGSLVTTIGSEAVSDLRFQAATRHAVLRTNETSGPEIGITGLADFGRPFAGNSARRENHYQLAYVFTRSQGRHLWKTGATVNRVSERTNVLDGFGGAFLFADLPSFFSAQPDFYLQSFGNPDTNFVETSYGGFFQDHWALHRAVTLDAGLRYDFEHLPSGFNQDTNNFSPRVGIAYSPSSHWVFRAGYGIFFDRFVLANINRAIEWNGATGFQTIADGPAAAQFFRAAALQAPLPPPVIAPSIFRPDPRMAVSYSEQASAGAEYLLAHNLTAGVNYLFVRGVKLSRTRNINLLSPEILTAQNAASLGIANPLPQQLGRNVFGPRRANPLFEGIFQLEDSAGSTYSGVTFSLNRRMANELEFLGSYTLSKTIDDASDFWEQPQNPFDLAAERALSRQNQQQRFVFDALWDLPIGPDEDEPSLPNPSLWDRLFGHIEIAPIFTAATAQPVNPLVGLDVSRSHAFPLADRPLGLARDSLKTGRTVQMDFRVLKYFPYGEYAHLDVVAEAFNLFNDVNVAEINPYFGAGAAPLPSFGEAIGGLTARRIQFSLDFEY